MRAKLLERELVEPVDVYNLAEILERAKLETQQFDSTTKTIKMAVAENQVESLAAKGKSKGTTAFGGFTPQMQCYNCGDRGHYRSQCTKPRKGQGFSFSNWGSSNARSSPRLGRGHGAIMRGRSNQSSPRSGSVSHKVRAGSGLATHGGKLALKGAEHKVLLNGIEFDCLFDTGASINYVIKAVVDRLGLKLNKNQKALVTLADHTEATALGSVVIHVVLKDKPGSDTEQLFYVLDSMPRDVLLGLPYGTQFSSVCIPYGGRLPTLNVTPRSSQRKIYASYTSPSVMALGAPVLGPFIENPSLPIKQVGKRLGITEKAFIAKEVDRKME